MLVRVMERLQTSQSVVNRQRSVDLPLRSGSEEKNQPPSQGRKANVKGNTPLFYSRLSYCVIMNLVVFSLPLHQQ